MRRGMAAVLRIQGSRDRTGTSIARACRVAGPVAPECLHRGARTLGRPCRHHVLMFGMVTVRVVVRAAVRVIVFVVVRMRVAAAVDVRREHVVQREVQVGPHLEAENPDHQRPCGPDAPPARAGVGGGSRWLHGGGRV